MGISRTVAWRGGLLAGICGLLLSLAAGFTDALATFEKMGANLRFVGESSRVSIGSALYNIDETSLRRHAAGLLAYPGVARVMVIDDHLRQVFIDQANADGARSLFLPISAEPVTVRLNDDMRNGQGRLVLYPDVGYVHDRLVDQFRSSVGVALGEAVIVLVALLLLTRRIVVAPVEQLTALANRIKAGHAAPDARAQLARDDEIGTLTAAFVEMAERLLKDAETLEQRVEERTRQLEQSRGQLIEREKMAALGSLVAGVAHEVNTPLGASVTIASSLQERFADLLEKVRAGTMTREDLREFLEKGEVSGVSLNYNLNRAASLVASFKMIAVDETADARRVIDLRGYLEQIVSSLGAQIRRGRLEVELDCAPGIAWLTWPGALAQVATNLVMNAILHAYDGAGGPFLIRAERQGDALALHFVDHGKGIAAENLSHIWEPFWTTRRGKDGSGLGLSIVYNIVTQRLDGTVSVVSAPGAGAHFVFTFPLRAEKNADV